MEMTPSAFATELMRMMAAKMGQRYFIIKLKMRLRRKGLPSSVTSSSIFSTPMTRDTSRQVVMAAMGIMTELVDMTERKTRMIELGDAFIAFPGGTGTLEEIAEVMSKVSLGHLDAPCILYDLDGYYAGLKALLAHMVEMGLSSPERQSGIYFVKNLDEIKSILKQA